MPFEVVYWSEERANRITNAKVGNRLLGVTAVKRSRKSEAEAGEARRGQLHNEGRGQLLTGRGSGMLWVPAQPPLGTMGAGGRHESICERKRAKTVVFRVSEGQRRGVSPFRTVAAFRRCCLLGRLMKRGRDEKRRALRGTMGFRTGREGETACLARSWKLRRLCGYRPGGFHIGNLMIKGSVIL